MIGTEKDEEDSENESGRAKGFFREFSQFHELKIIKDKGIWFNSC